MRLSSVSPSSALTISVMLALLVVVSAFSSLTSRPTQSRDRLRASSLGMAINGEDNKFGMAQRVDSGKSLLLGLIVGSVGQAPVSFFHDVVADSGGFAQWELDTDAAALEAGLFAIVYRYCIRQDKNEQLSQGVVGAFVLVRTLSRLRVPGYCSAVPLNCGSPLGYLDWNMLQQIGWSGAESVLMFGLTALAVDIAMSKGYISKFPG